MKGSIITIGDEILIGQILDTNTQWMASELHNLGVELIKTISIADTKQAIVRGLNDVLSISDVVIVTGGLGPTKDDVTKHVLTTYFEDTLVLNRKVLKHIKSMFLKRGIPFNKLNEAQAMLPQKATVLQNKLGTAAGMWFSENKKIVISLPGVPYEMKGLMQNEVLPRLKLIGDFNAQQYQTYVLYGVGESFASEMLEAFEVELPSFLKLAYLPKPGRLRLRVTGVHIDKVFLDKQITKQGEKLADIFKAYQFFKGDLCHIDMVKEYLINKQLTLSVAESCTGGKIATEITKKEGVSVFFVGGVVAYHSLLKQNLLKVSADTIKKFSVVSSQVVKEMVLGVQKLTKSDYAIATTGNAGPLIDATNEELGVVYIAIATPKTVIVEKFNFGQPRQKVIEQAKNKAFEMLSKEIFKNR